MKIFFYTTVFATKVGGIEMIVETLCKQFVALGHEVALATETLGMTKMPFAASCRPGPGEMRRLLAWCDIHIQANTSLKAAWVWALAPGKTLYQHHNVYQRDDGTKRLLDRLKTWLARATPTAPIRRPEPVRNTSSSTPMTKPPSTPNRPTRTGIAIWFFWADLCLRRAATP